MDDDIAAHGAPTAGESEAASPAGAQPNGAAAPIDLERLAEKVYQLLRDEVRQARARGGVRVAPWGR